MSDYKLDITIREEEHGLFMRCVRKLLESTFIVGEKKKDMELYNYIARESNRHDIRLYLKAIGFDVYVDTNVKIAMLRNFDNENEPWLKKANVVSFTKEQYHLLLVLWEIYLENLGYHEENLVMLGDLVDKMKIYDVGMDSRKLTPALDKFKEYSLIDYDKNDKSEEAIITLYPSLQFGWSIEALRATASEYFVSPSADENNETFNDEEEYEEDFQ